MPGTKKRELIEQMIADAGADISITTKRILSGYRTTITVSGGDVNVPIMEVAEGDSQDASVKSALGHILRNDAFRIAMSRHEVIGQDLLNPQAVLEQELAKIGGSVDIVISSVNGESGPFRADAFVYFNDAEHLNRNTLKFSATEPNKDRARRVVAAQALVESLGAAMPSAPRHIASWASQASSPENKQGAELWL
jgi:hypothetical protein